MSLLVWVEMWGGIGGRMETYIPGFGAVFGFCDVVPALAVTTEPEYFDAFAVFAF